MEFLVVEVPQTSLIPELYRSRLVMPELRHPGNTVSLDDFGAGYTSLAHLRSLAVKELKLDIAFIRRLTKQDNDHDIDLVRATIELGHALGLRIVAEGIEDYPTLELLTDLGCDLGQGYFISKAKPAHHLQLTSPMPTTEPMANVE